ncbi:RnfABCDGE type electron transport complex subunit G [bacterium]|nr:RnfABCDGE type electron transport complex subunit G [bacterium]
MLIVRLGLILMFITAIASGTLALLNQHTSPIILEYKLKQQEEARQEVMRSQGGVKFEKVNSEEIGEFYKAYDEADNLVGYVSIAYGKGYSSTIETVAGYTTDFEVAGLKVTFQQETPGLGTKAVEVKKGDRKPWFLMQFEGKDATNLAVVQDRGNIDSITGATITSRAIAVSVKATAKEIKQAVEAMEKANDTQMDTEAAALEMNGEVTP